MAIARESIRPPVLPKQAVPVAALGGEVVVRGMVLSERLALMSAARNAEGTVNFGHVCRALAVCVLAEDGEPVFTATEWETFGGANVDAALDLFAKVRELSGMDAEASKKS
jgi:hypothetical protein